MYNEIDSDFITHSQVPMASLARQMIEQAWDLYCQLDAQGNLIYASGRFNEVIGCVPEQVEQIIEAVDSDFRLDVYKLFVHTLQTKTSSKLEFRAKGAGEVHLWMECTAIPFCDEKGEIKEIAFALQDRTRHKNQENRLLAMALHDPLTGLPNRRLFKEQLNQLLQQAKRTNRTFALLYVDIDDFKIINDTMGHDIGDAFLQEFVSRIQGCLREVDMFARMGGDEFTILLPAVDCQDHVDAIAQRILACVDRKWEVQELSFRSTVSMGITMYRSDQIDATQMMKEVDIALYQVKGKGRNHYQFYDHDLPIDTR
ncbi:diguanylate cyclase domain-containing protein [Paenibacillus qinlingensis]|uniref:Diguanylate cyclase (GGDEF)-like protein/PAS domain S-box-containing protein n=1 Tax=Paenibacillus qinlingensis TaxID=1837343 RepID=A0ABU1P3M6_9BACL|nr:diguanylate cyclase [Paenibacillus qinlingensis]MDR6554336.1 diguanylate cyclase (GGDEF)-like protein/PAS domain S-box-containing protein [Paenibacillus qinlingensis]